jgi:hypothetical protein
MAFQLTLSERAPPGLPILTKRRSAMVVDWSFHASCRHPESVVARVRVRR